MNFSKVPKKTNDEIFSSVQASIDYLIDENLLKDRKLCVHCCQMIKIVEDSSYIDKYIYRCFNMKCRKKERLFNNSIMSVIRKPINNKLLAIYEYLARDFEKRVINDCGMAKSTYQKLKKSLIEYFKMKNKIYRNTMIGGNYSVRIDETVIYKGSLVRTPSNLHDETPGLIWLVGLIEEHTGRMHIEVVENRKAENFTQLIKKYVFIRTLIITDGYPSYPKAIQDAFCAHEIVNHSSGFRNKNGFSTNNIENLWSLIRYEEMKRKGVKKSAVNAFLEEFIFRYYNCKSNNFRDIGPIWYEIVKFFIENKLS